MIPTERTVDVIHSSAPLKKIKMEVSRKNHHLLIPLLRDSLYSNKILAPIREYSCNALDAHTDNGIPNKPIQVTLPTILEPEFKIRDFGKGLDIDELSKIYFIYLESTKRDTNDQIGMLGLGSKSAFAYADLFIVKSIKNGKKLIATCPISGEVTIDYDGPSDEENGVEIIIPIKKDDINNFVETALNFYKYWDIKPIIINSSESTINKYFNKEETIFKGNDWEIYPSRCNQYHYYSIRSIVISGGISYEIDWNIIHKNLTEKCTSDAGNIIEFLKGNEVHIKLPIGSIEFTPNRESLQYTTLTIESLYKIIVEINNCIEDIIYKKINEAKNIWEAKIIYNQLFEDINATFSGIHDIKKSLNGKLKWNNIVINSGQFDGVGQWYIDKENMDPNRYSNTHKKILIIYTKKHISEKSLKKRYPKKLYDNNIIAAEHSKIIINDIYGKTKYMSAAAKYVHYKLFPDTYIIYGLSFLNKRALENFYSHYNFDGVPVIKISEILNDIETFKKSIIPIKNNVTIRKFALPYIDLNSKLGYYWGRNEISIKNSKNIIFVPFDRGNVIVKGNTISKSNLQYLIKLYVQLCQTLKVDSNYLYGINTQILERKWFQIGVKNGSFISIDTHIDKLTSMYDNDTISKIILLKKQLSYANKKTTYENIYSLVDELKPFILSKNSLVLKYNEITKKIEKYSNIIKLDTLLKLNKFNINDIDDKNIIDSLIERYPLMSDLLNNFPFSYKNEIGYKYHNPDFIKNIAHYINAVDFMSYPKKIIDSSIKI